MADGIPHRCPAQYADGAFCDLPGMDGAPFPLCAKHVRQVFEFASDILGGWTPPRTVRWLLDQQQARTEAELDRVYSVVRRNAASAPARKPVVYYLRLDGLIKIGFTTNLDKRIKTYPPNAEMLATEPGNRDVEAFRLRQFGPLRAHGREWFRAEPELLDFIDGLAA